MPNQLQDPMQRRVLRALGQCGSGQGISVDAYRGQDWRKAAQALVEQGYAEPVRSITLEQTYKITLRGRYLLRQELEGSK